MEKTAILVGSSTGNTESVAQQIADKLGGIEVLSVADVQVSDIEAYKNLILGTSTWGVGDLQDDWDAFLPGFAKLNLDGKTIAFFGLGDAQGYYDSFVDGMGLIFEEIKDQAIKLVGQVDTEGYDFGDSRAVYDGKFIGLPLDEDNESNLTEQRIDDWLSQVKQEL